MASSHADEAIEEMEELENYISSHSDARFTHSICDTCTPELYPELNLEPPKET